MKIARKRSTSFRGKLRRWNPNHTVLFADEIDEVSGILNGTTNYMLDKMITEGADFNTVLKEAQKKATQRLILPLTWKDRTHPVRLPFFPLWHMENF